jgi:hypothetical protein
MTHIISIAERRSCGSAKTNDPEMQARVLLQTKEEISPSANGMTLEGGPAAVRRASTSRSSLQTAAEWVLGGRRGAGSGRGWFWKKPARQVAVEWMPRGQASPHGRIHMGRKLPSAWPTFVTQTGSFVHRRRQPQAAEPKRRPRRCCSASASRAAPASAAPPSPCP